MPFGRPNASLEGARRVAAMPPERSGHRHGAAGVRLGPPPADVPRPCEAFEAGGTGAPDHLRLESREAEDSKREFGEAPRWISGRGKNDAIRSCIYSRDFLERENSLC